MLISLLIKFIMVYITYINNIYHCNMKNAVNYLPLNYILMKTSSNTILQTLTGESPKIVNIETLKKGTFFKKKNQKQILMATGYCRINKAYEYQKYDDIGAFGYIKKGTTVIIDFEF